MGTSGLLVHNDCTAEMIGAARDAIAYAKKRNITDPKILSEVGSRAADAVGDARAIGIADATQIQRISDNAADAVINGRKFTEPTLPTGGTPKGVKAKPDPNDTRPIDRQNEAADLLASNGYDVDRLPDTVGGNGQGVLTGSNPDYLIDGIAFDCFSPDALTPPRNIWSTVKDKTLKQANRIILNLDDYKGSIDDIVKQFYDWNHDLQTLHELLIVKNGKISRLIIN